VRIARYRYEGDVRYGIVDGEVVREIAGTPFPTVESIEVTGIEHHLDDVDLLAPVLPTKIIAVAKNYSDHAAEMGGTVPAEPMIFLKPSTSVVGPEAVITIPEQSTQVEHEAELAVIIGRLCKDVPKDRVEDVVLGYTCANDVTARDLQRSDNQWGRAKGFDTFCPLGPWICTGEIEPANSPIVCEVNGEVRQTGSTREMVHSIPGLVAFISDIMTLLPGDVILTGTPAGVGPMMVGDLVEVTVPGIGTLSNEVVLRD